MDSISKRLNTFFESININPLIFKEGKSKYSPWDFPESCEQEFKFLIEYINSAEETLKNIKTNLIMVEDIEYLYYLISIIEKALIAKGLPDKEIIEIKNKIYLFTNYRNLRLESSLNDILSDFKFIASTEENNLDLDEQMLFFEYSEREIKKVQEHLRLVYTFMNNEKSYYNLKCEANAIKESYGESSQNKAINTYLMNKLKLDDEVSSDEIYSNLVQEQLLVINKKISIVTKKRRITELEKLKTKRIEELSTQTFGENLISLIKVKYKQINISNLLLEGIKSAKIVQLAKQKRKIDDWPIAIESTEQFFNQKDDIEGDDLYE